MNHAVDTCTYCRLHYNNDIIQTRHHTLGHIKLMLMDYLTHHRTKQYQHYPDDVEHRQELYQTSCFQFTSFRMQLILNICPKYKTVKTQALTSHKHTANSRIYTKTFFLKKSPANMKLVFTSVVNITKLN